MRTEQEMYQLILERAEADERIRAVYMNGSRTNPNVPKDIFQDYDIVYVVTDTKSFLEDPSWIDIFGERLYMQKPEQMDADAGRECDLLACYGYLMQLRDGNRIDLHIQTIAYSQKVITEDKLCRVLLDKDGIFPAVGKETDEDYWVKKPSQMELFHCSNEFWWVLNNVAKGLWREEIPYAMDMLHVYVRPQLIRMLSWQVGVQTGFTKSVGKSGKYLKNYLTAEQWDEFLSIYSDAQIDHIWEAVFVGCRLFQKAALFVAEQLSLSYDGEEAKNSLEYLKRVQKLPKDAKEI